MKNNGQRAKGRQEENATKTREFEKATRTLSKALVFEGATVLNTKEGGFLFLFLWWDFVRVFALFFFFFILSSEADSATVF